MNKLSNFRILLILALVVLLGSNQNIAQNVGIGAESFTPDPSAMLEVKSTNKGLLPPRMTTEDRDAIENPATGLQIFNTSTNCLNYRVENSWFEVCGDCITNCPFVCGTSTVTFTYNSSSVTYGTVTSNGKCWMDRNLGATAVATSSTHVASYGDLFQWGRSDDGHQVRSPNPCFSSTQSSSPTPGSCFIIGHSNWYNGLGTNTLWQGVSGINNPCPSGWRVPTEAEWNAERISWTFGNNAVGAFASLLKLTLAGGRFSSNGNTFNEGIAGNYWSSSVDGSNSRLLNFTSDNASIIGITQRANGNSVRCIKD